MPVGITAAEKAVIRMHVSEIPHAVVPAYLLSCDTLFYIQLQQIFKGAEVFSIDRSHGAERSCSTTVSRFTEGMRLLLIKQCGFFNLGLWVFTGGAVINENVVLNGHAHCIGNRAIIGINSTVAREAFIGCGTGFVLSGIQREFQDIKLFGSDIFSEGLVYAEERVPEATFFQMDARNIPFENEFDVIGAFDVIEHIEEDEVVFSQIFRAVKSGGGIILTVPQHQWLWSKNDEIACHKRRYSPKGLMAKVEKAGFRILRLTSFVSFLLPLMAASRLRWRLGTMEQKDSGSELRQPPFINVLLKGVLGIERSLIRKGASFPAGGSLLCVGLKG